MLAADIARKQDPQLARIYYLQMTEGGSSHTKALCVVAANLAERAWVVMQRGEPYQIRDTDGRPVSVDEAKAIIADRWTVPEDVRRRRRGLQAPAGKAPQQVVARSPALSARPRGDLARSPCCQRRRHRSRTCCPRSPNAWGSPLDNPILLRRSQDAGRTVSRPPTKSKWYGTDAGECHPARLHSAATTDLEKRVDATRPANRETLNPLRRFGRAILSVHRGCNRARLGSPTGRDR